MSLIEIQEQPIYYVQNQSDFDEAHTYLKKFCREHTNIILSIDSETGGLTPAKSGLKLIQLYIYGAIPVVINFTKFWDVQPLVWLFGLSNILRLCHNLAFDAAFIETYSTLYFGSTIDTMLIEADLVGQKRGTSLLNCMKKYLDLDMDKSLQTYSTTNNLFGTEPEEFSDEFILYSVLDVIPLARIFKQQYTLLLQKYGTEEIVLEKLWDFEDAAMHEKRNKYLKYKEL